MIPTPSPKRRCAVCGSPLPEQTGRGRPRVVCRDEDSPTPGGCARWRDLEKRTLRKGHRCASAPFSPADLDRLEAAFPDGAFILE